MSLKYGVDEVSVCAGKRQTNRLQVKAYVNMSPGGHKEKHLSGDEATRLISAILEMLPATYGRIDAQDVCDNAINESFQESE